MYKSRKKIITLTSASAIVLGGFGVGAYYIVDSFNTGELKDKTQALYNGATSALEVPFDTTKNISLMDWIFVNMPTTFVFNRINGTNGTSSNFLIEIINNKKITICTVDYTATASGYNLSFNTPAYPETGITALPLGTYSYAKDTNSITTTFTSYPDKNTRSLVYTKEASATPDTYKNTSGAYSSTIKPMDTSTTASSPINGDNSIDIISGEITKIEYSSTLTWSTPTSQTFSYSLFPSYVSTATKPQGLVATFTTTDALSAAKISYTTSYSWRNITVSTYDAYKNAWQISTSAIDQGVEFPSYFGFDNFFEFVPLLK